MLALVTATEAFPAESEPLVLSRLEGQSYGLPLKAVERVVPMVEVSRLPSAPSVLLGMIDYRGEVVPVVDVSTRFGLPSRAPSVSDRLLIVRTPRRKLALRVDEVLGIREVEVGRIVAPAVLDPTLQGVAGIVALEDGLVVIQDLEALLSPAEEQALDRAMEPSAGGVEP